MWTHDSTVVFTPTSLYERLPCSTVEYPETANWVIWVEKCSMYSSMEQCFPWSSFSKYFFQSEVRISLQGRTTVLIINHQNISGNRKELKGMPHCKIKQLSDDFSGGTAYIWIRCFKVRFRILRKSHLHYCCVHNQFLFPVGVSTSDIFHDKTDKQTNKKMQVSENCFLT